MLRIAAFLLLAVCSSGAEPLIWGSRVVGTPQGPSPPMYFRLLSDGKISTYSRDGSLSLITIKNGMCYAEEEVWSSSCQKDAGSANITVPDVSKVWSVEVYGSTWISTAIFIPNCTFEKPAKGRVDVGTSFPLFRPRKGHSHVEIDFAVGGADADSRVWLLENSILRCIWQGITLQNPSWPYCRNLSRDYTSDLRRWSGVGGNLVVTVDWEQEGESPEVAECKSYRGESAATTSSGATALSTLNAIATLVLLPALL
ncbi:hypothetical protein TcWFU_002157 [Taenia crassiceps]|uniref:DUF5727 domain-containing protein n=1 Tax=Taenia crassiceps TaxID=6207 RepID=A0ABR4PZA8_9CEST